MSNSNNLPSNYKLVEDDNESQSDFNHNDETATAASVPTIVVDYQVEDANDDEDDNNKNDDENAEDNFVAVAQKLVQNVAKNKLSDNGWRSNGGNNKLLNNGVEDTEEGMYARNIAILFLLLMFTIHHPPALFPP